MTSGDPRGRTGAGAGRAAAPGATADRRGVLDAALAERLRALIRDVPDFPRAGVLFRDVAPVFADPAAFRAAVDALARAHAGVRVDAVVGVESRGFMLGAAVAYALGAGFVPVRKQGRLPGAVIARAYALEYGEAVLEMHAGALAPGSRVVVVDDLLATGGTAAATVSLAEQLGAEVVGIAFLVELGGLGGAEALGGRPHVSLVRY